MAIVGSLWNPKYRLSSDHQHYEQISNELIVNNRPNIRDVMTSQSVIYCHSRSDNVEIVLDYIMHYNITQYTLGTSIIF